MSDERCSVRDGSFVQPCDALARSFGKGVEHHHMLDMRTRKPSRSFVAIKSGEYSKRGTAMNVCPFCGERIDAPFAADLDDAETQPASN